MKSGYVKGLMLTLCLLLMPVLALADDFADYKTTAGTEAVVNLPTVEAGWFVAADYFPDGTTEVIDGKFEAEGRMIAANNHEIYLQRTYGSSQWDVVATVPGSLPMDPSFIHVSPDGSKIALGIGYGAPLVIIPTSELSVQSPQSVFNMTGAKSFPLINYYDGDWADNQYFVVNGGGWPTGCTPPYDSNPNCSFSSGVGVVDTDDNDPANHVGVFLVQGIPGASGDVDVDSNGNLLTGIGYQTSPNRTGEIKVWEAGVWQPTPGSFVLQDYETTGLVVADNLLSAAHMGEDAEGNLHVGGGDAFGVGGTSENGYAALIKSGIVEDIADGTRTTTVNDGNKADNSEYKFFAPDSCQDDSATGILASTWGRGMSVMWNPTYYETNSSCYGSAGSASDYWVPGVTPRITTYYAGSALDSDGDGIVDAADNAYLTPNPDQEDADGNGYGDVADAADFNDDGAVNVVDIGIMQASLGSSQGDPNWNADVDLDGNGTINYNDINLLVSELGTGAPYY